MFFMKKVKFLDSKKLNRKWSQPKFGISGKLLILLTSFLFGNLFGINFSGINWNFCLIFFIVLFFECLNFLIYRNFKQFVTKTSFFSKKKNIFCPQIKFGEKQSLGTQYFELNNKNQLPISPDLPVLKQSGNGITAVGTMKTVLESFRRGFLLGIFVEAFKVGS